ncbi:hypothetical protein BX600DRAFT_516446 [Xylariales sp. PMI_506]|nr:hypothetical protein BX600DRAFT_516446 [Xylariales sp. PMI_506]
MAVPTSPPSPPPSSVTIPTPCCPNCGTAFIPPGSAEEKDPHVALLSAQKTIAELEAQVRLLNQKAAAAVDRWADYEDELSRLRASSATPTLTARTTTTNTDPSPRSSFLGATSGRISQLLGTRKSVPNLNSVNTKHATSTPPIPTITTGDASSPEATTSPSTNRGHSMEEQELREALNREQELRRAAEGRLNETSREVEELSVSLFEQANEMVATERRARAKLEERVGVLERRDEEKRGRLQRLEGAIGRIERIGRLLNADFDQGFDEEESSESHQVAIKLGSPPALRSLKA